MALPSLLTPCIDDFVARAGPMLDRAVDAALNAIEEEMRQLPSQAQRQQHAGALREMAFLRGGWRLRLAEALPPAIRNPQTPKSAGMLSPSSLSLSLVDDDEVTHSIEASRFAQHLRNATEQPLGELDALMSSALGLDGIQADANVIRPDVFAQALRGVLASTAEEPAFVGIWMKHLAAPMGPDLDAAYRNAAKLLKQQSVQAAGYRVVTSPAPLVSQPAPMSAERPRAPAAAPADAPVSQAAALWKGVSGFAELISQALRGPAFTEFLSRGSAQARQALAPAYFAKVDQELAALEARHDEAPLAPQEIRQYAHLPAVERPMREVGTEMPLDQEVWGELGAPRQRSLVRTRLKKQAQNIGQVMGMEVVRQLVDQVAKDPRLLAPVREAIVALEPSLARLALQSPRFFGEEGNPARKLLEKVAARSFKYNDEFTSQFQEFFGAVSEHFNALNSLDSLKDEAPFAHALQELQGEWDRQDQAEEAERRQLLEAMQFAEARQAEAGEIAWTLGQRSDLAGVPAAVQDFLYGRWALVMAHARLKSGGREIDPGGFGGVVTDLLWTVKRETVLRDPAHAFELIPRVVGKLRSGLELLGDMPAEDDTFFKALEKLHRPVMKLRAKHRKQAFDIPSELPPEAEAEVQAPTPQVKGDDVYLAPTEQRDYGFQDTELVDTATHAEATAPKVERISPPLADALIAGMQVGCWVDLYSRRKWLRAQLTWASANAALFMFVSHGGMAHSMTKRSLQKLLVERHVRPVGSHAVVQHAIEQIAHPEPQRLAA